MLTTTSKLIGYLNDKSRMRDYNYIRSMVNAILKCGSKEDADILLEQYLANPSDSKRGALLTVFKKFGDGSYAENIFKLLTTNGCLLEESDTEILQLLGHFKYEPAKKMLAGYAFGTTKGSYYHSKDAVLGLLHFNCDEYQSVIKEEIAKCYNKGLFPEFIPALVCKLADRDEFLAPLYDLGYNYASTDCNGGIILGFSLCGAEGEHYFRKLLFDPAWETYGGGTGADSHTYTGLKNLGITFSALYDEIRQITDTKQLDYAVRVLLAMLRKRIYDTDGNHMETCTDLFLLLFGWKSENESDNLHDLIRLAGDNNSELAYECEKLLELKMAEEALIENYK